MATWLCIITQPGHVSTRASTTEQPAPCHTPAHPPGAIPPGGHLRRSPPDHWWTEGGRPHPTCRTCTPEVDQHTGSRRQCRPPRRARQVVGRAFSAGLALSQHPRVNSTAHNAWISPRARSRAASKGICDTRVVVDRERHGHRIITCATELLTCHLIIAFPLCSVLALRAVSAAPNNPAPSDVRWDTSCGLVRRPRRVTASTR